MIACEVREIGMIGIILLNLGGPDSPGAVRPFLYNLFSDREIIRLGPPFLQKPLARLISVLRSKKTEAMYRLIGGGSPILGITSAQAAALEKVLNEPVSGGRRMVEGRNFRVYVGMRYWRPFIGETVAKMHEDGITTAVAVSLYPHYSLATSGSALSEFSEVIKHYPIEAFGVASWHDHPLYIEALVDSIKKGLAVFKDRDVEVLFSAHSLPLSIVESGDPYVGQILGTIGEVAKKLEIRWHLAYQSRSGPVRWLSPRTDEKITELSRKGVRNLLVVPISFVSDHIETLYEIDILYKRLAEDLGMGFARTESLNTHPLFIEALRDLVLKCLG